MAGLRGELEALLGSVRQGEVTPAEALERLVALPYRDLGFARVDVHRELRQGAPEAVLAEGKTPGQVAAIVEALVAGGAGSVLVTRAGEDVRAAVRAVAPDAREDERARAVWIERSLPEPAGLVVLVSAGTSDRPVLHEAGSAPNCSGQAWPSTRTWAWLVSTASLPSFPTSRVPIASSSSRAWTRRSRASSAASSPAP